MGLLGALVLVGCGQIIEVPVESAGTDVETAGVDDTTTGAIDTTDGGSTTDVDQPTGADDTGTSTGGEPDRMVVCVTGTIPFADNGGLVTVPVEVVDVVAPSDVWVGVRVPRPTAEGLQVTVTRGGTTRSLIDVDECPPMVDLLFDDLAEVEAEVVCAEREPELVAAVIPQDSLAPLLDEEPNGTGVVNVSQPSEEGSVESVCVSFGLPTR